MADDRRVGQRAAIITQAGTEQGNLGSKGVADFNRPRLNLSFKAASWCCASSGWVMLDADLADLYGVQTKVLVQAVKRNLARFRAEFMFQRSAEEFSALR